MKKFRKFLALTMVLVLIIFTGCQKKSLYEERLEGSLFTSHQGLIYFDKDHIFVQMYTDLQHVPEDKRDEEIEKMRKEGTLTGELTSSFNEEIKSENPVLEEDGTIKSDSLPDLKIDENGHIVFRDIDFVFKVRDENKK
ncbi:hypothetical protein [Peptoniphilus duerdenii]|uniref:hypothetical protein n=1 Tax=Peptoniphilus duerdenii TaxID=507750 RepID=UPI002889F9BE|nr:hypothetical protein [Peptoniphilus duerdenii]